MNTSRKPLVVTNPKAVLMASALIESQKVYAVAELLNQTAESIAESDDIDKVIDSIALTNDDIYKVRKALETIKEFAEKFHTVSH